MDKRKIKDLTCLALIAAVMFASKKALEFLPNVHTLAPLIAATTIVYRKKALLAIYVYVMLEGISTGFNVWWITYLYVWTILWCAIMLLPKKLLDKKKLATTAIAIICGLHGLAFGLMCLPVQALFYGLSLKGAISWLIAGLPFDFVHMIGNLAMSLLTLPIVRVIKRHN